MKKFNENISLNDIIFILKNNMKKPEKGLPEEIFKFVSSITPLVNVDLLIKNDCNETLLTWRNKMYHFSAGWHIPGGIIRFKEKMAYRIEKVAEIELGAKILFNPEPIAINEIIIPELTERGHFISFLYECNLITEPDKKLKFKGKGPKPGEWKWFYKCPDNLIEVHKKYYKTFFGEDTWKK